MQEAKELSREKVAEKKASLTAGARRKAEGEGEGGRVRRRLVATLLTWLIIISGRTRRMMRVMETAQVRRWLGSQGLERRGVSA